MSTQPTDTDAQPWMQPGGCGRQLWVTLPYERWQQQDHELNRAVDSLAQVKSEVIRSRMAILACRVALERAQGISEAARAGLTELRRLADVGEQALREMAPSVVFPQLDDTIWTRLADARAVNEAQAAEIAKLRAQLKAKRSTQRKRGKRG